TVTPDVPPPPLHSALPICEPEPIRQAYGDTPFARSCLLARRLVEAGVRCVTVYYVNSGNQPWDTHSDHDKTHRKLCADSDRATRSEERRVGKERRDRCAR